MSLESFGDIHALPEDCIANALSLTSPKDACRLSAVASTFRSASQSDVVWGRFLPSDYRDLIAGAVDGPDALLSKFRSKKDLYLHLCDHPILIDGGRKKGNCLMTLAAQNDHLEQSFSLEKCSGKKCYMIAARDIHIVWGDTPEYWQWISLPESRFPEVAELLAVCLFEIRGKISTKMLSPGTCYVAYLVFTLKPEADGFYNNPAEAFVELAGHESERRSVFIHSDGAHTANDSKHPTQRGDGWMEVELGEYFVEGGEDADLELGVHNVWNMRNGNWKSGFVFQGIEVRPKAVSS
ncbi:F-box family protein [Striga asiatica]|uniref:F-box family protein n=1 Tax=Striga asiatica TaxID=4170 RepID=A0A5A7Q3W5_STRAF|nr:F-box family protein [Striga asiatica]